MIHERSVQVDGLDLYWLEAGAAHAPPVLLLHGWPTSAQLWRHALPAIGAHRRAIALDLPGFGRSSKPLDVSYSFRFWDALLPAFLDAVGVDRLGLVVHDLGGPIGLHWAVQHRERITDLVLLNTLVYPDMSWAVKAFVAASFIPGIRHALSSPWGLAASMRFGVTDTSRITPEVAAIYQAPFPDRASRRALLKTAHALHPGGFQTIADGLPGFADIPVGILYGEDDRILPDVAKTMGRVRAALPHARVTTIPRCGHFLQEDRPDEVASHLARMLDLR